MPDRNQVVFHVGYPKSGSTFIQREILLKSNRVMAFTPNVGTPGYAIARLLVEVCPDDGETPLSDADRSKRLRAVRADIDGSDRIAVFSNEAAVIGNWQESYDWFDRPDAIRDRIRSEFEDARIVFCLREQADWIDSWMRQYLRSFEPVRQSTMERLDSEFWRRNIEPYLRYDEVLEQFYETFGAEDTFVVFYRELSSNPSQFVHKLCGILQIPEPDWQNVRHRPGYSSAAATARLHANRAYYSLSRGLFGDEYARRRLDHGYARLCKSALQRADIVLNRLFEGSMLGKDEQAHIHGLFRASNRRLAKMLKLDLAPHGFVT